MIEAIVFDLGNTLFTATSDGYNDERLERRLGLPAGTMEQLVWGSAMERAALVGAVPFEEFWQWVGRTLGLSAQQLADFDDGLWAGVVFKPTVATWLGGLLDRFRLAALSNAWSDARAHTEGAYGLEDLLEFIAYSAEIGYAKPDPRAYELVMARLGVSPDRTVFVDDSQTNIDAASALGMLTVRCIDPEQMMRDVDAVIADEA